MANKSTRFLFEVLSGYELRVIITSNITSTGRRLSEDLKNTAGGFVYKPERPGIGWLVLPPNASPGLIAHEAYHATLDLLKHHGASPTDEEQVAHWLEHITDRVYRFIRA
jgi:hypothetical protein